MIRTLTIVENKEEGKETDYSAEGSLPLDEAARTLIILSFNAGAQQQAKMQAQKEMEKAQAQVKAQMPVEPKKPEEEKKEPEKAPGPD